MAKHLVRGAAVAERHRENAGLGAVVKRLAALWRIAIRKMLPAGRCSVAERHRENAGRSAVAKRLAALWRIAIGKTLPAGRCAVAKRHREDADDRELPAGSGTRKQHREATPPRKAAGKGAAAGFDF